jgi:hypothetical protein
MHRTKAIISQNITAWPELGINYWGINKNATSTMTMHFATLCGDIIPTDEDIRLGQLAKSKMKHRYITQQQAHQNGLQNFAVCRHPLQRFYSIYKHLKHPTSVLQQRTRGKARFDTTWNEEQFLAHIRHTFDAGKKINKHWQKQVSYVPEPERMHHVVKLERLVEDWPFEFEAPSIQSNTTTGVDVHIDEQLVHDVYHEDYLYFGYILRKDFT